MIDVIWGSMMPLIFWLVKLAVIITAAVVVYKKLRRKLDDIEKKLCEGNIHGQNGHPGAGV